MFVFKFQALYLVQIKLASCLIDALMLIKILKQIILIVFITETQCQIIKKQHIKMEGRSTVIIRHLSFLVLILLICTTILIICRLIIIQLCLKLLV